MTGWVGFLDRIRLIIIALRWEWLWFGLALPFGWIGLSLAWACVVHWDKCIADGDIGHFEVGFRVYMVMGGR